MTHDHSSTKKKFHIDYCFVSKSLLDKLVNVEVGGFDKSDHTPFAVTFKLEV